MFWPGMLVPISNLKHPVHKLPVVIKEVKDWDGIIFCIFALNEPGSPYYSQSNSSPWKTSDMCLFVE